eukprot:5391881-Ditylum_brightwellii.AAC.1
MLDLWEPGPLILGTQILNLCQNIVTGYNPKGLLSGSPESEAGTIYSVATFLGETPTEGDCIHSTLWARPAGPYIN